MISRFVFTQKKVKELNWLTGLLDESASRTIKTKRLNPGIGKKFVYSLKFDRLIE